MKPAVLLLLSFCGLCSVASAQLLLDSRSFSAEGKTDVAVKGRIEFWKDSALATSNMGTVKIYVDNLSVYKNLNGALTGNQNGILTGLGFNVGAGFSYMSYSFSETVTGPVAGLGQGAEPYGVDFTYAGAHTVDAEKFEATAYADDPVYHNGVTGGFASLFSFRFKATDSASVINKFNAAYFFADADKKDLYFHFEGVSSFATKCTDLSENLYLGLEELPPTPEPSTYGVVGAGVLLGMAAWRRRSKRSA